MIVGSNVKLKCGGPLMTIITITGQEAGCAYWDINNNLYTDNFPLAALVLS